MDIYLKNIRVINPVQNLDSNLNILIRNGVIEYLSEEEFNTSSETKVIDGSELVCSPGLFDMHVHFREPGFTHKETLKTGIEASANGGFTGVLCMPNTNPPIDSVPLVDYIYKRCQGEIVDVYPSAGITQNLKGEKVTSMLSLSDAGALMFTDDGNCVLNSDVLRRAFDYSAPSDLLIAQHCEDTNLSANFAVNEGKFSSKLGLKGYPSVAEEIILSRDILLAMYCGNRRYHAQHISSKGSVEILRRAKSNGSRVSAEVTPHHIAITEAMLENFDTNFKMNPPLRTEEDVEALIGGLKDNTIDCIATDHAPHSLFEKDVEFEKAPNGVIGLETALGVVLTFLYHKGHLTLSQIIEKMSINPRRLLGLATIYIQEGEKANLTIFAPNEEWVVDKQYFKSKSKNSPFEGFKLKGKPKYTINNGLLYVCNL
jgi:dihydroorotase